MTCLRPVFEKGGIMSVKSALSFGGLSVASVHTVDFWDKSLISEPIRRMALKIGTSFPMLPRNAIERHGTDQWKLPGKRSRIAY